MERACAGSQEPENVVCGAQVGTPGSPSSTCPLLPLQRGDLGLLGLVGNTIRRHPMKLELGVQRKGLSRKCVSSALLLPSTCLGVWVMDGRKRYWTADLGWFCIRVRKHLSYPPLLEGFLYINCR